MINSHSHQSSYAAMLVGLSQTQTSPQTINSLSIQHFPLQYICSMSTPQNTPKALISTAINKTTMTMITMVHGIQVSEFSHWNFLMTTMILSLVVGLEQQELQFKSMISKQEKSNIASQQLTQTILTPLITLIKSNLLSLSLVLMTHYAKSGILGSKITISQLVYSMATFVG